MNTHVNTAAAVSLAAALAPALAGLCGNAANPDAIELEPMPRPAEMSSDMDSPVAFDAATTVTLDCPDAEAAAWLASHLAAWYGKLAPRVVSGKFGLPLRDGDEAYAVRADASGVKVAARSLAGVRWAAYSLRQLAIARRGTMTTEGHVLPTLSISDAPRLAFRGVHLCWFPEVRAEQVERAVRLAALMKFNYVVLETWGTFRSERHPWFGWADGPMTKAEVRRLAALGRDLGVKLVPQVAAFGHAGASRACSSKHSVLDMSPEHEPLFEPGGWNWCLTNPAAQKVLRELVAELLDAFGSPPYVHLGCDEAQPPSCPECRKRPYGELAGEHVAGLAAFAKERGARAMIWHDMMLDSKDARWKGFIASGSERTAKMADTLPKDVVVCDWQYGDRVADDAGTTFPTMRHFAGKGFSVVGCPWLNVGVMREMAETLAEVGGAGYLQTTWLPLRGNDWVKQYRFGSWAAWGSPAEVWSRGDTPMCDTMFDRALRMVGHDMKVSDYRDAGRVEWQVPRNCP